MIIKTVIGLHIEQSTEQFYSESSHFQEEEDAFHDNAEEERKKNKQRQRLKKKQEMEAGK